jgi:hypothetical protein
MGRTKATKLRRTRRRTSLPAYCQESGIKRQPSVVAEEEDDEEDEDEDEDDEEEKKVV